MKGSALPIWISVVVLALTAYAGLKIWRAQAREEAFSVQTTTPDARQPVGPPRTEFTLTERSGLKFHSRDWRGDVWVASVFFSACPSVCLELNKTIAEIQKDERFKDVKFVSITCDTRNDTPSVLTSYANRFGADKKRWLFCTGQQTEVEQVAKDMLQIAVQGVTHSERAVIFDRAGKSRGGFVIANPRFVADRINFDRMLLECLAEPRPVASGKTLASDTQATTAPLTSAEAPPTTPPKESPPAKLPPMDVGSPLAPAQIPVQEAAP
jgi:cytochrome oxidase Cu insertion factor (SCO1/SenC/PrrC family)